MFLAHGEGKLLHNGSQQLLCVGRKVLVQIGVVNTIPQSSQCCGAHTPWHIILLVLQIRAQLQCNGIVELSSLSQSVGIVQQMRTISCAEGITGILECITQCLPLFLGIVDTVVANLILV